jgi:hypothetical protein
MPNPSMDNANTQNVWVVVQLKTGYLNSHMRTFDASNCAL